MTGRLPWVAATVVVVIAAGLGAWALSQGGPTPTGAWSKIGTASGGFGTPTESGIPYAGGIGLVEGLTADNGGIIGIYIMDGIPGAVPGPGPPRTFENNVNLNAENGLSTSDNQLENISYSGESVNIPYERIFSIVVDAQLFAPTHMAYTTLDNAYVWLGTTGEFLENENTWDESGVNENEVTYLIENAGTTAGFIRFNTVMDNRGNGYFLRAGQSITIDVAVYGWR